jgi:hypothetical protein
MNSDGEGLAVEHTLIENFPRVGTKEKSIAQVSQTLLDDVSLRVPERIICMWLPAEAFDPSERWRWSDVGAALVRWASSSFSTVPIGNSTQVIEVPVKPGVSQSLEIRITASEAPGNPGIVLVHGLLPVDSELVLPALKRAIFQEGTKAPQKRSRQSGFASRTTWKANPSRLGHRPT